jgi:hypothetical protein
MQAFDVITGTFFRMVKMFGSRFVLFAALLVAIDAVAGRSMSQHQLVALS